MRKFNGSKVLVTGHTGFKGSWLSLWLKSLGAEVSGVSFDIPTDPSHFQVTKLHHLVNDYRLDIRNREGLKDLVKSIKPDFVFHLAAQALVYESYQNPLDTIETNVIGTANLLDSLRMLEKEVTAVIITSDKAYDNVEWVWGYREDDRLGGKDPYSASKGMAELAIKSYVNSFFNSPESKVTIGIARAGNVIGGGDWADNRIVPDCMKSWSRNKVVDIRSPYATRPWQHVLEPLSGYLALAINLSQSRENHGEAYNFGPTANQNHSVKELIESMTDYWQNVRWNDVSKLDSIYHEASLLKLNCDKALFDLNWTPTLSFDDTVRFTIQWYKYYFENIPDNNIHDLTISQINEYTNLAKAKGVQWALL